MKNIIVETLETNKHKNDSMEKQTQKRLENMEILEEANDFVSKIKNQEKKSQLKSCMSCLHKLTAMNFVKNKF
jgi:hypothetical protein